MFLMDRMLRTGSIGEGTARTSGVRAGRLGDDGPGAQHPIQHDKIGSCRVQESLDEIFGEHARVLRVVAVLFVRRIAVAMLFLYQR